MNADLSDIDYVEGDIVDTGAVAGGTSVGAEAAPGVA